MIDKAFILGAGLGTRMRPLTDHVPKPLAMVAGETLIDRTLDQLFAAGITEAVINTHYKAPVLEAALQKRNNPKITISHEPELLDTGGGIRNTLKYFDNNPFFVLSGDGLWADNPAAPALLSLQQYWNPDIMDILILLQPVSTMKLTHGVGDYIMDGQGRAARALDKTGDYMFTSMRINHPRIFEGTPETPFSYLQLLDKAQDQGRLYGLMHRGDWHHLSTPQDVEKVEAFLLQQKAMR